MKLLLDVSLTNLLQRFETCEIFLRSPNNFRGIVFITFFLRSFHLAVKSQIIQRRIMGQVSNELYRIWKEVVVA